MGWRETGRWYVRKRRGTGRMKRRDTGGMKRIDTGRITRNGALFRWKETGTGKVEQDETH